jgi:hypothetical protein
MGPIEKGNLFQLTLATTIRVLINPTERKSPERELSFPHFESLQMGLIAWFVSE